VASFPQVSPIKTLYTLLYSPHASTISFLILSHAQYWVKSTDHEAPHYEVFSTPCYLVPLRPKYSPQHPIPSSMSATMFHTRENYSSLYLTFPNILRAHWFICSTLAQLKNSVAVEMGLLHSQSLMNRQCCFLVILESNTFQIVWLGA
jgi:hypothetical protein